VPLDPSAGPAWHRISRPSNAPGVETLYLMLHGGAYEMKRGASIERPFHLPQEARTLLSLERDGYTLTPIPAPAAEEAK
jgi:hypothetical protein